jgi:hypothetical protein
MSSDTDKMSFDRVVSFDGSQTLTATEFYALPLEARIKFLLQQRPRFYRGNAEVERAEALKLRAS